MVSTFIFRYAKLLGSALFRDGSDWSSLLCRHRFDDFHDQMFVNCVFRSALKLWIRTVQYSLDWFGFCQKHFGSMSFCINIFKVEVLHFLDSFEYVESSVTLRDILTVPSLPFELGLNLYMDA